MSTAAPAIPGYCVDGDCPCHRVAGLSETVYINLEAGFPYGCCKRCGRRGPKPVTIVLPGEAVTPTQLEARIQRTRAEHGEVLQKFHEVWYNATHTWTMTSFLGVQLMKNPMDLWAYQELITSYRPKTIIETGTLNGGSALWFAVLMDALDIEGGRILTVDLDDHRKCQHDRITFVGGDSTDPAIAAALLAEVEHPLLISLDADHSTAHVRKELDLYAPAVWPGEYLIVEDTNIGWGDERGARGAVADYLTAHPGEFKQDITLEKHLVTCHPGGFLRRMRSHGA